MDQQLHDPVMPPSEIVDNLPNGSHAISTQSESSKLLNLYKEPLDTPGLVPQHLKRATLIGLPLLEILQRLVYRLQPGHNIEKLLALIALYRASVPVYKYLKHAFIYLCTSQITVPEYDPVAKEILNWMASEVMSKSHTTEALMLTSGSNGGPYDAENYYRTMMLQRGQAVQVSDEVQMLPPIGRKFFWQVRFSLFTPSFKSRLVNARQIHAVILSRLVQNPPSNLIHERLAIKP